MATQNNLRVPDELLAELRLKANAEGKSVEELATQALRTGLEERSWQELLEYGQARGRESGYTEEDVPRIVKEWRRELRGK
jgi:plasmid stability protein